MVSAERLPRVVIAGGGMVGLACAIALAEKAFDVQVWERHPLPETCPEAIDPRVSALTRRSELLLQRWGAWERIPPDRRAAYRSMKVWPHTPAAALTFSARDLGEPNLGHIVENSVLRQALLEEARQRGVAVLTGRTVEQVLLDADKVWLESSDGGVAADVLVVAEGAMSPLRHRLGLDGEEHDYRQVAHVALVEAERSFGCCASQRFLPSGPLAFLPVSSRGGAAAEGRLASIVWSLDGTVDDRKDWDEHRWLEALQEASQNEWGRLQLRSPIQGFPLRARHARAYHQGRAVLVGDSAHNIHPLAGQGVNLGFADVEALARRLRPSVCRDAASVARALEAFERDRRSENQLTLDAMTAIRSLFRSCPEDMMGLGLDGLNASGGLKNSLARTALHGLLWH